MTIEANTSKTLKIDVRFWFLGLSLLSLEMEIDKLSIIFCFRTASGPLMRTRIYWAFAPLLDLLLHLLSSSVYGYFLPDIVGQLLILSQKWIFFASLGAAVDIVWHFNSILMQGPRITAVPLVSPALSLWYFSAVFPEFTFNLPKLIGFAMALKCFFGVCSVPRIKWIFKDTCEWKCSHMDFLGWLTPEPSCGNTTEER